MFLYICNCQQSNVQIKEQFLSGIFNFTSLALWKRHANSLLQSFRSVKPIFHLATLLARREAKTRIRGRDWLKLAGEKTCREQVVTVPIFLSVRANKFAKWKIGLSSDLHQC